MVCRICNKERGSETRLGICWSCAEAQSVIHEGLDMYEKGPNNDDAPAKTAMDKLKFLIKLGWSKS